MKSRLSAILGNNELVTELSEKSVSQHRKKWTESCKSQRRKNPKPYKARRPLDHMFSKGRSSKWCEKELGYTKEELVRNIESKFKNGMNWGNKGDWQIDHITPIQDFIDRGITCPKAINALDNLQPLWKEEHLKKSAIENSIRRRNKSHSKI